MRTSRRQLSLRDILKLENSVVTTFPALKGGFNGGNASILVYIFFFSFVCLVLKSDSGTKGQAFSSIVGKSKMDCTKMDMSVSVAIH